LVRRLGLRNPDSKPPISEVLTDKAISFSDKFLIDFFQYWRSNVLATCGSVESSSYFEINHDVVSKLLVEIEISARRSGLCDEMKKIIEQNFQFKGADKNIWIKKQTCSIAALFNEFICHGCHFGFDSSGLHIETLDKQGILIFKDQLDDPTSLVLPDFGDDISDNYFIDWLQGIQFSVITNSGYRDGVIKDLHSNNLLGQILIDLNLALET
jgi:hypothetical protein